MFQSSGGHEIRGSGGVTHWQRFGFHRVERAALLFQGIQGNGHLQSWGITSLDAWRMRAQGGGLGRILIHDELLFQMILVQLSFLCWTLTKGKKPSNVCFQLWLIPRKKDVIIQPLWPDVKIKFHQYICLQIGLGIHHNIIWGDCKYHSIFLIIQHNLHSGIMSWSELSTLNHCRQLIIRSCIWLSTTLVWIGMSVSWISFGVFLSGSAGQALPAIL